MWNLNTLTLQDPLEQFLSRSIAGGCPAFNMGTTMTTTILLVVFSLVFFHSFFNTSNLDTSNVKFTLPSNNIQDDLVEEIFFWNQNWSVHSNPPRTALEQIILQSLNFIKLLLKDNLNINIFIYIPIIYFIFWFLLLSNFLGLLPFSITITSMYIITLFFSLSFFIGINIIGCLKHGLQIFHLFLPTGVPVFIIPLLICIEVFSYFARICSLSIRLFANMMAGHSLLKILIVTVWQLIFLVQFYLWPVSFLSWFSILPLFSLELAIAFLQAYIFTLLLIIYLNDVINLH